MRKVHLVLFLVFLSLFSCTIIYAAPSNEVQNLDVSDADIRDVFRSLGDLGGYNILLDKKVQGSISFKISNPLAARNVIELVAQTYGYTYRWTNNDQTVIIGDKETFKSFDNRFTKVYRLNYANVNQATEALKVVVPTEQIGKDERANQLTIRGSILEHENIEEIIKDIDREVPQVNIEARIEEITESALQTLGFTPTINGGYGSNGWYLKGLTDLKATETAKKARLIANPNICTTDNQEAKIMIGQKYPVITSSQTDKGVTYTVSYIEVGTKLTVTPRINSDNIVTVAVIAEVSVIKGWQDVGNDKVPLIDTREVRSVIRLKEGETFVLSGLVKKESNESTTGTPFLSKIPILGWLFKVKSDTPYDNVQTCIFITPHIVKYAKDTDSPKKSNEQTKDAKENGTEVKNEDKVSIQEEKVVEPTVATTEPASTTTVEEKAKTENGDTQGKVEAAADNKSATTTEVKADNEPITTQEESPAPPPEPIQVVIDEKNPTPATTTETPAVDNKEVSTNPGAQREIQYTLKKGETIFQISRKFGVDAKEILNRNQLTDKDKVKVGQVVVVPIPADHLYQLQPKETLWRIAKRYGTTVEELVELNGLADATQVKVGQTIVLPTVASKVVNSKY